LSQFDGNDIDHFPGSAGELPPAAAGAVGSNNRLSEVGKSYFLVSGALETDTSWTNNTVPFFVNEILDIEGDKDHPAQLNLAPGVRILFSREGGIHLGWQDAIGSLVAVGTDAQPIIFTSGEEHPTPGSWQGIGLLDPGKSILDHCIIEYAGRDRKPSLDIAGGAPSITNSFIRSGGGMGVQIRGDARPALFRGNTVTKMLGPPLEAEPRSIAAIDADNSLTGNQEDVIRLSSPTVDSDVEWKFSAIPYLAPQGIHVEGAAEGGGATLTLAAGTRILFGADTGMTLGWGNKGSLKAIGETDKPIVFTSSSRTPAKGDWKGINLALSGEETILQYVRIEWAGRKDGDPVILAGADACGKLSHVTISHSGAMAIELRDSRVTQENCDFEDVDGLTGVKPEG